MGKIHSIETMGLMDGPGIRMVVFLQGCPLRCKYCHNPDTQSFNAGEEVSASEIIAQAKRLVPYFKRSGGGVTVSGGEPLQQPEFLIELFKGIQAEGICTVLDTSGYGRPDTYDEILKHTNLVLLDLKHFEEPAHYDLVKVKMREQQPFIDALIKNKTRLWVRHVMVPGITDDSESMKKIATRIIPLKERLEKIEILPYMTFGVDKYKQLGKKYPLEGVPAMDKSRAKLFECELISYVYDEAEANFEEVS